ncbi:MAG: hypothetical protein IPJ14_07250 [Kineosporiaceae bacterium]|nr:hypothetical protein [Kineosporiaceae bacterium]
MRGSVDMLTELMAGTGPRLAFARATQIKGLVSAVSSSLGLDREWNCPWPPG